MISDHPDIIVDDGYICLLKTYMRLKTLPNVHESVFDCLPNSNGCITIIKNDATKSLIDGIIYHNRGNITLIKNDKDIIIFNCNVNITIFIYSDLLAIECINKLKNTYYIEKLKGK